jgi:hypothetical protein
MSEVVISSPASIPKSAERQHKLARKSQTPQFPARLTVCFADDQVENLQQVKKAFRCSESFAIRMAFDAFCRNNGFPVSNGGHNGR